MNDETTTTTLRDLAHEAAGWFETATRATSDEVFTRTKDGAPEWVKELVYAAHGGDFLPDDWRYETTRAALDFLAEGGDEDDTAEFADGAVDVYTAARFAWLSSNLRRQGYVDEALEEFGHDPERGGVADMIGLGQYAEASEVFGLVVAALNERLEEIDAAETFGDD